MPFFAGGSSRRPAKPDGYHAGSRAKGSAGNKVEPPSDAELAAEVDAFCLWHGDIVHNMSMLSGDAHFPRCSGEHFCKFVMSFLGSQEYASGTFLVSRPPQG